MSYIFANRFQSPPLMFRTQEEGCKYWWVLDFLKKIDITSCSIPFAFPALCLRRRLNPMLCFCTQTLSRLWSFARAAPQTRRGTHVLSSPRQTTRVCFLIKQKRIVTNLERWYSVMWKYYPLNSPRKRWFWGCPCILVC